MRRWLLILCLLSGVAHAQQSSFIPDCQTPRPYPCPRDNYVCWSDTDVIERCEIGVGWTSHNISTQDHNLLGAEHGDTNAGATLSQGAIIYYDTGVGWTTRAIGSNERILTSDGSFPQWQAFALEDSGDADANNDEIPMGQASSGTVAWVLVPTCNASTEKLIYNGTSWSCETDNGAGVADSVQVGTLDIDTIARFTDDPVTDGGAIDFARSGAGNPHIITGTIKSGAIIQQPQLDLATGASPTTQGRAVFNTSLNTIQVGDGATTRTMATLNTTQTLSGKTLTSPVINGGNINQPTLDLATGTGVTSLGRMVLNNTLDTLHIGNGTVALNFYPDGRLPSGTALPGTCEPPQTFFDTDATPAGENLYCCTATDTWTLCGDGGGSGGGTECSTSPCNLNVATTLNSQDICLDDGTNCNISTTEITDNTITAADFKADDGIADDPAWGAYECYFAWDDAAPKSIICEGDTADNDESSVVFEDPAGTQGDSRYRFPQVGSGNLADICLSNGSGCPAGTGGDVTAATTLTDERLIRGDTPAKGVQESGIVVTDTDDLQNVNSVKITRKASAQGFFTLRESEAQCSAGSPFGDAECEDFTFALNAGGISGASDVTCTLTTAAEIPASCLDLTASVSAADMTGTTGTGNFVLATSPTLVTPALGTPSSATLTNATGLPISTGVSGLGTGVATFLATPSSANLLSALTTKTGTGNAVFSASPTFTGTVIANTVAGVQAQFGVFDSAGVGVASSGVVNLANDELMCWEASPAGTDVCLTMSTSEALSVSNGTIALPSGSTIPSGTAPTVDAAGKIAVDTTQTAGSGQLRFHDGTQAVSIPGTQFACTTRRGLATDDDNIPIWTPPYAVTLIAAYCQCTGTCTTEADITLERDAGGTVTGVTGTVTCEDTTTGDTLTSLSGATSLAAFNTLRFDTADSPDPGGSDDYQICWTYRVDAQ